MAQTLLFPDPRPLVERLGTEFFRQAPQTPGVYLMRDPADTVLYVGKAKNLRKRLASYRVANPDRMPRRHLRLVRAVARIELKECADEPAALVHESELLRTLRPRFNRAGTWPGPKQFLAWRVSPAGLELAVLPEAEGEWQTFGPISGAAHLRSSLARLLWCAAHSHCGPATLPAGWFRGHFGDIATIPHPPAANSDEPCRSCLGDAALLIESFLTVHSELLVRWIADRTAHYTRLFDVSARNADLELLEEFVKRVARSTKLKQEIP